MKFDDLNLLDIGHTIQLAGVVYAGKGGVYIFPLPGEGLTYTGDAYSDPSGPYGGSPAVVDMTPEDWVKCLEQTDQMHVEVTHSDQGGVRKAIQRKCQRQIDATMSWKVFRRDGYTCRYCGAVDRPLTVDHLVLWEQGGPTIPENLLSSCKKCNKTRGNTEYADWLKSPEYARLSVRLDPATRAQNEAVAATLAGIRRVNNIRSR